MPIKASCVGTSLRPWTTTIDARRLMAYAAGLGHTEDIYFDTTRPEGILNHPLFALSPEWDLLTDPECGLDALGLSPTEAYRGVHACHDLHLHRSIPAGSSVTVSAQIVGLERTKAGALLTMRMEGRDAAGPLWTTWMGSLYRGVDITGDICGANEVPVPPQIASTIGEDRRERKTIETWAPHVYSECGRLWNPIHTDRSIARAAGLPGVILHGSATLAHGIDWVLATLGASPAHVRRLGGSFRDIVLVPSTISIVMNAVEQAENGATTAHFSVLNESGNKAIRDAFVLIHP